MPMAVRGEFPGQGHSIPHVELMVSSPACERRESWSQLC